MIAALLSFATLLVMTTFASNVPITEYSEYENETPLNDIPDMLPNIAIANKEYFKEIQSLIDDYRGERSGRTVIETNALINTKYRTWKRNADLINSLLALPKGMNDAGRR